MVSESKGGQTMRMTQFHGLTQEAEKFLEENCRTVSDAHCPNCLHVLSMKRVSKQIGSVSGMDYSEQYPLLQYELKDRRIVREEVQAIPWSSGPMIFYRLVEVSGEEGEAAFFPPLFEWDQTVMEES